MRKLMIVFLVVLAVGCSKKFATVPPGTAGSEGAKQENAAEAPKEDIVEDVVVPGDEKVDGESILESSLPAEGVETYPSDDVFFDFDKYDIRPDARVVLDSIAASLLRNGTEIAIEGHCDERGTNDYNLALGEKRAEAVKRYLEALGVSGEKMDVITYGEEKPVCTGHNELCYQKNRRAHVVEDK